MKPVHVGCGGWQHKEWRGALYPEGLPQRSWLSHYAGEFGTVEINNTFYRLPSVSAVEGWVSQTPDEFRFAVKAGRYLTHIKRLQIEGRTERFQERLKPMIDAGKLAVTLWQMPEAFHRDDERLDGGARRARQRVPGPSLPRVPPRELVLQSPSMSACGPRAWRW